MDDEQKKVIFILFVILVTSALVFLALENKDIVLKAFSINIDFKI